MDSASDLPSDPSPAPNGSSGHAFVGRPRWHSRLVLAITVVAVCAALVWTALGGWDLPPIGPRQTDYYNLLANGFRKGSLGMDVEVPDALARIANPWDPANRPKDLEVMHDASYNHGHYYMYFGVVPAAVVFLPFRIISGHDLPLVYGFLVFSLGATLVTAWLYLTVLFDAFPGASLAVQVAGLAALPLAGGQWGLARRVSIWEPPIAAGHCFLLIAVAAAYQALRSRQSLRWLALAGLALGLAIGSRGTLLSSCLGLAVLVIAVAWKGRDRTARGRLRALVAPALAAGLPLALIGCLIGAYNYARFGSVTEFGMRFQLNATYERMAVHFSPSYVGHNLRLYFLALPHWGRYFPFVHPTSQVPGPPGYFGYEYVYSVLVVCPVLWGMLALGLLARRRDSPALRPFVAVVAAVGAGNLALILVFYAAAGRYEVDFLPWGAWLGLLGFAEAERRARPGAARAAVALLTGLAGAAACILALGASAEIHDILKLDHPEQARQLSAVFDVPTWLWDRVTHAPSGAVETRVRFDGHPKSSVEPLVVTGVEYQKDYLYVFYESERLVRFGYHSSGSTQDFRGDPFPIEPGRHYTVVLSSGSLYPPAGYPGYRGWTEPELDAVKRWVSISVEGQPVLLARAPWNDASPGSFQFGRDPGGLYGSQLSGTIEPISWYGRHRRVHDEPLVGQIELKVQLPPVGTSASEPLWVAGKPGAADLVGLHRTDPSHFVVTCEEWSVGLWTSPAQPVNPLGETLVIRIGSTFPEGTPGLSETLRHTVAVSNRGVEILSHRSRNGPVNPQAVYLLRDPLGSSALQRSYSGRLESARVIPVGEPDSSATPHP